MTSNSRNPRRSSGVRLPIWAIAILLILGLVLLLMSSVWLFRTVRGMAASPELELPEFGAVEDPVTGELVAPIVDSSGGGEQPQSDAPESLPAWTGAERVNILLMGVDRRCDEEGPTHSDTIMLATVDPTSKTASILSLPRDLWVEIPGFDVGRINQAYFYGQAYDLPGGGAQLAVETVENFLGVPIDYYATVDFQAFVEIVDLIGGVVVEVPEAIDDPTYPDNCYGYEPFSIGPGVHRLDGARALKYARTRATFGGDVDRAERQQQVILALRDQVTSLDSLSQLLLRAPQLWQSLQDNVDTNLELDEALQLGRLALDIPFENIQTVVLDFNYVFNNTTFDGQQVLVPIRDEIRKLRDEIFAPPVIPTPALEALPETPATENARVAVFNGTAEFGLAAATQEYLQSLDVNVTEIGNADSSTYVASQVIDYGSHPATVQFLVQTLGVPPLNISTGTNPAGDFDVLVILGSSWEIP